MPPLVPTDPEYAQSEFDEDEANHVPRPPNSFIMFRAHWIKKVKEEEVMGQNVVTLKDADCEPSRWAAEVWHSMTDAQKEEWREKARLQKQEHDRDHPGYLYKPAQPRRKKTKPAVKRTKHKTPQQVQKDQDWVKIVAEFKKQGRTAKELKERRAQFDREYPVTIVATFVQPLTSSAFRGKASSKSTRAPSEFSFESRPSSRADYDDDYEEFDDDEYYSDPDEPYEGEDDDTMPPLVVADPESAPVSVDVRTLSLYPSTSCLISFVPSGFFSPCCT